MKIVICDFGINNSNSIINMIKKLNSDFVVIDKYEKIKDCVTIIPGVGHFQKGMELIKYSKLDNFIKEKAENNDFLIGICLGAQLLLQESEEAPGISGLGIVKGKCAKLNSRIIRVPQQGWEYLKFQKTDTYVNNKKFCTYFSHSYEMILENKNEIEAYYESGGNKITAIYRHNNIVGFQFHPEKSGIHGVELLKKALNREI
jgi:glutamine amidotransferase